jgi:transposase
VNHIAIDLGSRESQVCMRGPDGTILDERKVPTRRLPQLASSWPVSRIILETSAEAFRIADAALASGHEVRVVPATLSKTLGVGARGVKTDLRDARALSQVSCQIDLPSVHVPSSVSRELKSLCGSREILIENRTKTINNVRGWLRTQLWRVRSGSTCTLPMRVRALAAANGEPLPEHVERMLQVVEMLTMQIKGADRQVQRFASEHPTCRRLMTTPGVGPVTAVRFVAAIDDVTRFRTAHAVQSYLGLTPGEDSSSERERRTGITKAGPSALRRVLIQGAWVAIRRNPNDPMVAWADQIARRRGQFVAVVALARKLAGILFALWRDGTTYHPSRSAKAAELP